MPLTSYKLLKGATQAQLSQAVQLELDLGNRVLVYQAWSRGGYLCQGVGTGTLDSGSISSYFVITNANDESFATLLNTQLPHYQPVGAPIIHNGALYQVMAVITANTNSGTPGKTPVLRVASGYIQWKYETDTTWTNLVALTAITGPSVEITVDDGYIKWRQTNSEWWENLVSLDDLKGSANTLTIGTVENGSSPSATITGTAPNQTLNLTMQKGDTGPANVLSVGTVTTLSPGDSATATITGTAPKQTINFGLPQGATGEANSLSVGTVTTGTAAATITGTAPNQTLNLTIPNFSPQSPVSRTVVIGTAYQHTDTTRAYRVIINVRATQKLTEAGTAADQLELRVGSSAASVAASGSDGFSIAVWESGITGIDAMIGAEIQDGSTMYADIPAGWYFQINRLSGTNASIVSCFTQTMGV